MRQFRKSYLVLIGVLVVAPFAFVSAARALPWNEVGDAGELPATAQVPIGLGALTSISGSIGPTGAGGGSPISGWTGLEGTSGRGTYTINVTGAEFVSPPVAIPEAGTFL